MTRYAYFKSGDASQELKRFGPAPEEIPDGGPFVFTGSFLRLAGSDPARMDSMGYVSETTTQGNVRAETHPYRAAASKPATLARNFSILWSCLRGLRSFKPDLLLCPLAGPPLWTAWLAARLTGAAFVISRHNLHQGGSGSLKHRLTRAVDERIFRRTRAILCHGEMLREQLLALGVPEERIFRFEVGFRDFLESGGSGPERDEAAPEGGYILFAGRMTRTKGIFDLLDAFKARLQAGDELSLLYAGQGPGEEGLQSEIERRGLGEVVRLLGPLPRNRLSLLMRHCRYVVTPTRSEFPEGRCMVTAEAFVHGRPVIAPDYGPFRFYLSHGENALLYPPDSVPELERAMAALNTAPARYYALCAGAAREGARLVDADISFEQAIANGYAHAQRTTPSP